ncbi:hypothetical protein YC2023_004956 [Brassica napus]
MLSRSALYPQRSRTAYFVVTNSHLLSLPQVNFLSSTFWFLSRLFFSGKANSAVKFSKCHMTSG